MFTGFALVFLALAIGCGVAGQYPVAGLLIVFTLVCASASIFSKRRNNQQT